MRRRLKSTREGKRLRKPNTNGLGRRLGRPTSPPYLAAGLGRRNILSEVVLVKNTSSGESVSHPLTTGVTDWTRVAGPAIVENRWFTTTLTARNTHDMMNSALAMYGIGVIIGAAIPISIWRSSRNRAQEATEAIVRDNIRQRAYLEASYQVNDDETNERIKQRGQEILEEYDLDVIDVHAEVDDQ